MGANLNWLAAQAADKSDLLERLGFVEAGMSSDELNVPVACAVLPGNWVVIASWGKGLDLDRLLPRASTGTLALGAEMDERVMFSQLGAFRDGRPVWAVTHDPERGRDDVTVHGEPPELLAQVRAELSAERAEDGFMDADYMFEAPVRLSEKLCGYHPEGPLPVEWTILEPVGRRLSFTWREDPAGAAFETSFLVFDGQAWDSPHLVMGVVRPMRPAVRRRGGPFWRRLLGRGEGDMEPMSPEDRMAEFVGPVRQELAALDRFLISGEPDARIGVRFGSAEGLRSASA